MADDPQNETQDVPKSAADLRIEELIARINDLESAYKSRIQELEDANKGLWLELHKVPADSAAPPQPAEDPDPGEQALKDALGLK